MSAEILAGAAGVILSLLFSYIPGLNANFARLPAELKRGVMLLLVTLTGLAAFGLACSGLAAELGYTLACTRADAVHIGLAIVCAAIGNQAAYGLSPRAAAVLQAKAAPGMTIDEELARR